MYSISAMLPYLLFNLILSRVEFINNFLVIKYILRSIILYNLSFFEIDNKFTKIICNNYNIKNKLY